MIRQVKNIFSQILIGKKKNKFLVNIHIYKSQVLVLDFLWKEGYIFGYKKLTGNTYSVFLKNTSSGNFIVTRSSFLNKKCSSKRINIFSKSNKNVTFLVKTAIGIISQNECIDRKIGGTLIIKI